MGFPHSSAGKGSACNAGDSGSIPGLGRSSGAGNGNSLQYPCLENPMYRGAWQATVCGVARVRHDWVMRTHIHTHTQSGIQENDRWTHLQGRNRDADIENGLVETAAGEGEAGTDWDSSITQVHYNWSTRQLVGSCCIAQGTQILGVL